MRDPLKVCNRDVFLHLVEKPLNPRARCEPSPYGGRCRGTRRMMVKRGIISLTTASRSLPLEGEATVPFVLPTKRDSSHPPRAVVIHLPRQGDPDAAHRPPYGRVRLQKRRTAAFSPLRMTQNWIFIPQTYQILWKPLFRSNVS